MNTKVASSACVTGVWRGRIPEPEVPIYASLTDTEGRRWIWEERAGKYLRSLEEPDEYYFDDTEATD